MKLSQDMQLIQKRRDDQKRMKKVLKSYQEYLADGTLSRYKARLIANGSTLLEGVDVDETFSLVVKPGTIRTILSLAASRHWLIHQLDVKNAFFTCDLFMGSNRPPEFGFSGLHLILLGLDFLIVVIIKSLHQDFAMTDLGPLNYFLGISVTRDSLGLFLSQKKYAIEILERAHVVNCNPSWTFVDTESKLGMMVIRSAGLSLYDDPREPHFAALKRILRYVRGTLDYGLQLFSSSTTDLVAYSDAD
ncbi:ribonuclease H-like domain-containing protein [Tanacetum coccineum]|uniref:Ribonuclease H-like domain-containing protein n=1 Tax=Tanacetum coccineum TaxID=301880 RepID=A0ABQ4XFF8_9ASTR